jgi:hypothetical protein
LGNKYSSLAFYAACGVGFSIVAINAKTLKYAGFLRRTVAV